MRYKVNDKVKVKSLDWYNKNKNEDGDVDCGIHVFSRMMFGFCGKVVTIKKADSGIYDIMEDNGYFFWTDDMFEGLADEENESESIDNTADLLPKYVKITRDMNEEQAELDITEEYEYVDEMGNVIDTAKIIIRKRKPKYPTTYEECCDVLKIPNDERYIDIDVPLDYNKLLTAFTKLLICRDAYLKIAGDWKPDFKDGEQKKYCIFADMVNMSKGAWYFCNTILAFPIEEMRDAFYENFKDLIESCKELL